MVGADKGKIGVVKAMSRATNSVFVDGLNTAEQTFEVPGQRAQILRREKPLDVARGEVSRTSSVTFATFDGPRTKLVEGRSDRLGSGKIAPGGRFWSSRDDPECRRLA